MNADRLNRLPEELRPRRTRESRLRSATTCLGSRLYVRVQKRPPPMTRGAKLLRAQADRAAQIGALEVRTLKTGIAHDRSSQDSPTQVGILEIGVQKNTALELRAGQVCSNKLRSRDIRVLQIGQRQYRSFQLGIAQIRPR